MKAIFTDLVEFGNYCRANNLHKSDAFFYECKICKTFYGTIKIGNGTCSTGCEVKFSEIENNIVLARIKAQEDNVCLDSKVKVGEEIVFILHSNFSLKNIVMGKTRFNYLLSYNTEYLMLTDVLPLKNKYDNIDILRSMSTEI
jgi:hypothetical protein